MAKFVVYGARGTPHELEADDFTVTESGHVVFWRGGQRRLVFAPSTYKTIARDDDSEPPKTDVSEVEST